MNTQVVKKTLLTSVSVFTLLATSSMLHARDLDVSKTQKELRIMTKIFETSLEESSSNRVQFRRGQNIEATYLANQGMVFSFNFSRNAFPSSDWGALGEGIGQMVGAIANEVGHALADMPLPPEAPSAPTVVVPSNGEFSFDYQEYAEAVQERMEALEEMRERHREQREQVRELQREIRSLERQSAREKEQSKELEKVKRKLEEKVEVLDKKMAEYKKSMAEYRQKRDQKYIENAKKKSNAIISTLCDYGATMRTLKSGERVTIIFKNYNGDKDQIYVFNSSDVKRCEEPTALFDRAISYQL